jgi:hypothetical protein
MVEVDQVTGVCGHAEQVNRTGARVGADPERHAARPSGRRRPGLQELTVDGVLAVGFVQRVDDDQGR